MCAVLFRLFGTVGLFNKLYTDRATTKNVHTPHTPAEWANLRNYALETTRERIAKICAPPKSYYPSIPVWVYPPSAEWRVQPPHL